MSMWTPYINDEKALDLTVKLAPSSPQPKTCESPDRSSSPAPSFSSLPSPDWSSDSRSPVEFVRSSADDPLTHNPEYQQFREGLIALKIARNGGSIATTNPKMRRSVTGSKNTQDAAYIERRAKNNAAAKRSRDQRKMREDELEIRTAYLEQENRKLMMQLQAVRSELVARRSHRY